MQKAFSRRERQIMDVLHARGRATAHEVRDALPDPPSYSAVRALLAILETKGHVKHAQDGPRYVYSAVQPKAQASKKAVAHLLETFFGGSIERAVAALLDVSDAKRSKDDLDRLARLVDKARKEGR